MVVLAAWTNMYVREDYLISLMIYFEDFDINILNIGSKTFFTEVQQNLFYLSILNYYWILNVCI